MKIVIEYPKLDAFLTKKNNSKHASTLQGEKEQDELPEGWKWVLLGRIAKTTSGGTPRRSVKRFWQNGTVPWVKSGELEGNIIFDTEEKITKEGLKSSSAKMFPKGTLIVALYGATVGKTAILGIDATTNQAVCAIFPKDHIVIRDYIRYYLIRKRPELILRSFGGAQPNISQTFLKKLKIPLPRLDEQERIVTRIEELLSRTEEARRLKSESIEETENIMQCALLKIFLEAKEKGWKLAKIEDVITDVKSGFACSKKHEVKNRNGIPHLRPNNIGYYGLLDSSKLVHLPKEMVDLEKYSLKRGDVLFNNTNSKELVGRATLVREDLDYGFSNHITRLRVNPRLLMPEWLASSLNYLWLQGHFLRICRKWIGQAGVNTTMLKSVRVFLPSLDEQKQIALYLERLQEKTQELRQAQEETEKKLEDITMAVLDRAFKGEL